MNTYTSMHRQRSKFSWMLSSGFWPMVSAYDFNAFFFLLLNRLFAKLIDGKGEDKWAVRWRK